MTSQNQKSQQTPHKCPTSPHGAKPSTVYVAAPKDDGLSWQRNRCFRRPTSVWTLAVFRMTGNGRIVVSVTLAEIGTAAATTLPTRVADFANAVEASTRQAHGSASRSTPRNRLLQRSAFPLHFDHLSIANAFFKRDYPIVSVGSAPLHTLHFRLNQHSQTTSAVQVQPCLQKAWSPVIRPKPVVPSEAARKHAYY